MFLQEQMCIIALVFILQNSDICQSVRFGVYILPLKVGARNVLQIISHLDDANNLFSPVMLSGFPHIFWSPCTSKFKPLICILMEEIAGLDLLKPVVLCAKEIEHCVTTYQQFSPCSLNQDMEQSSDRLSVKFNLHLPYALFRGYLSSSNSFKR